MMIAVSGAPFFSRAALSSASEIPHLIMRRSAAFSKDSRSSALSVEAAFARRASIFLA